MKKSYNLKSWLFVIFLFLGSFSIFGQDTILIGRIASPDEYEYSAPGRRLVIRSGGDDGSALAAADDGYTDPGTGGTKLSSTGNIGDGLEDVKTYIRFSATAGEEIKMYFYATSSNTTTFDVNVSDSTNSSSYIDGLPYSTPTSKKLYDVSWTVPYDGTFYYSTEASIYVTTIIFPPSASISVSPTSLTGFNYGNDLGGPSSEKSFTITGITLTAAETVDVAVLTDYEVSTDNTTYSSSVSFPNTLGGDFSETVYVRLKSGLSVASYPEILTVSGGGAPETPTVNLEGSVTATALIELSAPTLLDASDEATDGFTANWESVTGASGYTVNVYQSGSLVTTVDVGSGTTTYAFSGLDGETTYTYKVQTLGDGTTYTDSDESTTSESATTLPTPTASPCEITLYSTDFTDWGPVDQESASSTDEFAGSGGGEGFTLSAKPTLVPSDDVSEVISSLGLEENGYLYGNNSTGTLLASPELTFIDGGSVVLYVFSLAGSDRGFELTVDGSSTGVSADEILFIEPSAIGEDAGNPATLSGNGFLTGKDDNGARTVLYKVTFSLPSGLTGDHTIELIDGSNGLTDLALTRLTICTDPDSDPLISANPYDEANFSGAVGGNESMQYIEVKGFNLSTDVTVTISGTDAGRFSAASTILQADAEGGGYFLPVYYTSSVLPGSHAAEITFSSTGADDVVVDLLGITTPDTSDPVITTSDATIILPTSLIQPTTTTILVTGVNLTDDVTLDLSGTDAAQFSVDVESVDDFYANSTGYIVTITYNGAITEGTEEATLTLSSTSASDVEIPLLGKTYSVTPTMYTLTATASPIDGGLFQTDIVGPDYPSGTLVVVTAVAEAGYEFVRWSDISSYSPTRNISMTSDVNITAVFAVSANGEGAIGELTAYNPDIANTTTTGFRAEWSTVTDATSYTVTVYDEDGTEVASETTSNTYVDITGLTPNERYAYQVEADTGTDRSEISGPYELIEDPSALPACGEE